jgi:WD40 repeat protein
MQPASALAATPRTNPYVGPRPFESSDAQRFFGRERESAELFSLIIAHRAVLLYSPSGAGKSSLLNAAVIPRLREADLVVDSARVSANWTLPSTSDPRSRVLVFDQFEELFRSLTAAERSSFLAQLAGALEEERERDLRVVLSMREEWLASIEPHEDLFPEDLQTRYRLDRLSAMAAADCIAKPVETAGMKFAQEAAEALATDLAGDLEYVEPVQLQIACFRLFDTLPAGTREITKEHLRTFGDVNQALREFYLDVLRDVSQTGVRESRLRSWFDTRLISEAGARALVPVDSMERDGIPPGAVQLMDAKWHIIREEIRDNREFYELSHDRFVEPIRRANDGWRRRQEQKRVFQMVGSIVIAVGVIALLAFLYVRSQQALQEVRSAQLKTLEARGRADAFGKMAAIISASARGEKELSKGNWQLAGLVVRQAYLMRSAITEGGAKYSADLVDDLRHVLQATEFSDTTTISSVLTSRLLGGGAGSHEIAVVTFGDPVGIKFWSVPDLRTRFLRVPIQGVTFDVDLSPDGASLAALLEYTVPQNSPPSPPPGQAPPPSLRTQLSVFDLGRKTWRVLGDAGYVNSVSAVRWSPDGTRIATASNEGIRIWDFASGRQELSRSPNLNSVVANLSEQFAWSPNSQSLAAVSQYYAVPAWARMIRLTAGGLRSTPLQILPAPPTPNLPQFAPLSASGPAPGLEGVNWSSNNQVAACTWLGEALWTNLERPPVKVGDSLCKSIVFSPNGERIATLTTGIEVTDLKTPGTPPVTLSPPNDPTSYLATSLSDFTWSPDGQQIAAVEPGAGLGLAQPKLRVWHLSEKLDWKICEKVRANLSQAEWDEFFGAAFSYQRTCKDFPSGKGAPPDAPAAETMPASGAAGRGRAVKD